MLSIKLGYGRPAALAEAFAAAFFSGDSFLDFFLGFGVSQTGLDFIVSPLGILRCEGYLARSTLQYTFLQVSNSHNVPRCWLGLGGLLVFRRWVPKVSNLG